MPAEVGPWQWRSIGLECAQIWFGICASQLKRKPVMSSVTIHQRCKGRKRGAVRPILEVLEDRYAPAVGLFIENFSNDLNPSLPGFDQFDNYPARDINP